MKILLISNEIRHELGSASNRKALYLTIVISIIVSKVVAISIKHYIP
jgi:hypothetical protein